MRAAFSFVATGSGFHIDHTSANDSGLVPTGQLAIENGETIRGQLFIRVNSMSGGTFSFPGSVTMTLVDVPEPASLEFLTRGLAGLALARVSRKA